jgi:SagB-type dehydrogenase family enzyme
MMILYSNPFKAREIQFSPVQGVLVRTLAYMTAVVLSLLFFAQRVEGQKTGESVPLPAPKVSGSMALEAVLNSRRYVRDFLYTSIGMREVSQLLWACAGMRIDGVSRASRTSPSAGGIYPLSLYVVAGKVQTLGEGVYRYLPESHALELLKSGDYRRRLAAAALGQVFIADAPASIVITANYRQTERVYGERGKIRYVPMDAGHAAENLSLQAVSLGLGTVAVGAFVDERVKSVLDLDEEEPLYILPVGWPRR